MIPKSLLFLCLLPSLLFSQELLFENTQIEISTMDPDKGLLYHFSGDSLKLINMANLSVVATRFITRSQSRPFISMRPIWFEKKLLLSEKNGGELFKLQNDSLKRIDQSDIHNWQSFSGLFVKNDTLYKYGGYGYWTASNALSYYDKTSKGWEVVPFQDGRIPKGTHSHKHQFVGTQLYILGGYQIRGQNRLKTNFSNDIWSLNLSAKKWHYKGEVSIPSIENYKKIHSSNPNDFELFNSQYGLLRMNLSQNIAAVYSKNPLYFNIEIQDSHPVYKYKGHYYYYDIDNLNITLKKSPENVFVLQQTAQIPIYTNKASLTRNLLLLLVFSLSFIFLVWFLKTKKRKKKTLFIYTNTLRLNQKESGISPIEYDVLKLLNERFQVESTQILSIVCNESLTKSHNEKIKTQTVEGLNLKLSYLLGAQNEYIASEKSKEDKRIRVYSMNLGEIMIKIVS